MEIIIHTNLILQAIFTAMFYKTFLAIEHDTIEEKIQKAQKHGYA